MSPKRLASLLLAAVVLFVLVAPAGASSDDARRKRDAARQRRAAIARELDALQASDRELTAAVAALDTQMRTTEANLASARQAVAAAERARQQAESQLAETEQRLVALKRTVVQRAVAAYIRPANFGAAELQARDFSEASRRRVLLDQVASSDRKVIDDLRAAQEDFSIERQRAEQARAVADKRKASVEGKLRQLQTDRAGKERLARALDARIAAYNREADLAAAQEAQLVEQIRQRSAVTTRASRSAPAIDSGGRVSGAGLIWPVNGRVTSEYGYRWGRLHAGIDIAAPMATPLRAAKGGVVIRSGSMGGYGYAIVIDHGGGFTTLYAHQSRLVAREGQSVSQGELIGYIGSSGNSTGPHVHFETRVNGDPQNPRRYLP